MAVKVRYKDKSGKSFSVIFPSEKLAEAYARQHKDAVVEPVEAKVPQVSVRIMEPSPEPEAVSDDGQPDPDGGLSKFAEDAIKRRLGCYNA